MAGVVIAEGLTEPSLIDGFAVYKARISPRERPIDDAGEMGRWYTSWVTATPEQIDGLLVRLNPGRYAHFWAGNRIVAVFSGQRFEFRVSVRTTWGEAVAYGRSLGIPEGELDLPTDGGLCRPPRCVAPGGSAGEAAGVAARSRWERVALP